MAKNSCILYLAIEKTENFSIIVIKELLSSTSAADGTRKGIVPFAWNKHKAGIQTGGNKRENFSAKLPETGGGKEKK